MSLNWLPPLRLKIDQLCLAEDIPEGIAIAWIQVESGGEIGEVTRLDERGYFQLMPSESHDLKLDHMRLSVDSDYSLEAGFKLMHYYRVVLNLLCNHADVDCVVPGSEYQWRMIKLCHAIGQGAVKHMLADAANAGRCLTWEDFTAFMIENDDKYLAQLKHDPKKWIFAVNEMFVIAKPYGVTTLPSSSTPISVA